MNLPMLICQTIYLEVKLVCLKLYFADACLVDSSFCGADLRTAHLQVHQL